MVGTARRKELAADLRAIFAATSREQALGMMASSVARRWREKGNEKVAEHLEEHMEECLPCLAFPESLQAHPYHQRPEEAKPGNKTSHASSEDLPEPGVVSAPGD